MARPTNHGPMMATARDLKRLPRGRTYPDPAPRWRVPGFERFRVGDHMDVATPHQPVVINLLHKLRARWPDRLYLYRRHDGRFRVWRVE